jgi:hypothetical protein
VPGDIVSGFSLSDMRDLVQDSVTPLASSTEIINAFLSTNKLRSSKEDIVAEDNSKGQELLGPQGGMQSGIASISTTSTPRIVPNQPERISDRPSANTSPSASNGRRRTSAPAPIFAPFVKEAWRKPSTTHEDFPKNPSIIVSQAQRSAPNAEDEDDVIDTNSVSSSAVNERWSDPEMSAASSTSGSNVNLASAEVLSLLVKHPHLQQFYAPAIVLHGRVKVRLELCSIFRSYGNCLKSNATSPQECKAGELVRSCAKSIAYACVAFNDPDVPDSDVDGRSEALHRQKNQAASRVEGYLDSQGKEYLKSKDIGNSIEDFSDDTDDDDIDQVLPNLSNVNVYMTSGTHFEQLCKEVRDFSTRRQLQPSPSPSSGKSSASIMKDKDDVGCTDQGKSNGIRHTPPSSRLCMVSIRFDLVSAVQTPYHILKCWTSAMFWPKLSPKCTRIQWKCVSLPQETEQRCTKCSNK